MSNNVKSNTDKPQIIKIKKTKNKKNEENTQSYSIKEQIKEVVETEKNTPKNENNEVLKHLGDFHEEPFELIKSYFDNHLERLVRHQLESFNYFINYQIQKTIQMFNPTIVKSENDFVLEKGKYLLETHIFFENFKMYSPVIYENNGSTKPMLPHEAKLRNFSYSSAMTIDLKIHYVIRNTESMENPKIIEKILPKINIGKMPIMLKSSICILSQYKHIEPQLIGECPLDCGGYFIIKGSEKTVLGQERAAENRIYCFDGKNTTKWIWTAEIKSVPDFKCISPKQFDMMVATKNNGFGNPIFVLIPKIKQPIELYVLFRAFGIISDKDITQYILLDIENEKNKKLLLYLQASVVEANKYLTQEDALRHITSFAAYTTMDKETGSTKKREFTVEVLNNDMFPHCSTITQKLYFLGYMANRLIQTALGLIPVDDRDSYLNKRIELTGTLLNNLYRNYFNKLKKEMNKQVIREVNNGSWRSTLDYENIINMTNIYKIIKSTTIENGISRALATGDFSIKQANSSKVGVAQVLSRLTYVSSLSHIRRINTPLEKSGELIAPRKLHGTTWGYLCCLTGDTEVLLSNRIDTKKIKDIQDGDCVNTVNRETLQDEPSEIYKFFCKMADNLYELITIDNRKIKATGDHPFLIKTLYGNYEMKKMEILTVNDTVVVRTENGCICVQILSINEIEPELVYDFTTRSENHSFVASSFVVSNCAETPEGQSIGIVKNLSYMAHITIPTNSSSLYEYIEPLIHKLENIENYNKKLNNCVKVFINGAWVGVCDDPIELYNNLKDKKYRGIINIYTSIIFDYKKLEIRVCNDGGRLTRPLLKVRDNKALITTEIITKIKNKELTWNDLLTNCHIQESVIEYIDPEEQNLSMIAMKSKESYLQNPNLKVKYTHCEIHPSTILGVLASCIVFPEHNQSPRNCYQTSMQKQAIGVYSTNFDERMDKTAYVLTYPTRPLVDTRLMNYLDLNKVPSGNMIYVAIASHTGYNCEDSVLINQGSIDRGMFLTTIYHTEVDQDKNIIRDEIIRCKPDKTKTKGIKFGNYDKLNSDGFIPENELVENNDIIIAKIVPIKENRNDPTKTIKFEDQSKPYKTYEETYIDKNLTGRNGDGYNFAKVRVRILRKPVIGDKFACSLPTQQVLTDKGWVEIKDIDINIHKVATLDKTGNMLYEYPINKFEYDHNGQMYYVKNKQIFVVCTLNHKLYVKKRSSKKYELIEAQNVMGKMVRFQKSLNNIYPDIEFIELESIKYKMDDWLRLLGMFISDGSTNNSGSVHISCFKDRKVNFNTITLNNLNIKYYYDNNNGFFSIRTKEIYNELKKSSLGALNKFLPEYVWSLSKRQSIILLEALLEGDGNHMEYKGENFSRYYTVSIKLANDITRLATHCGWSGIIKIKEKANEKEHTATTMGSRAGTTSIIIHKNDYYMISIIRKQNESWINKKDNISNEEKLIDYNGKVYCIEMPSSNLYYMRENDFSPSMLIGNSRSKCVLLTTGGGCVSIQLSVRKN